MKHSEFIELMMAPSGQIPLLVIVDGRYIGELTGRYSISDYGDENMVEVRYKANRGFFGWLFRRPEETLAFEPIRRVALINQA